MNKKQIVRINENQLKQIVMESVKKVLKEWEEVPNDVYNSLNMNKERGWEEHYDGVFPKFGREEVSENPSHVSIKVLKPFFIKKDVGDDNYSRTFDKVVILPNQTIELSKEGKYYVGNAKYSHYYSDHPFKQTSYEGYGNTILRVYGYTGIVDGQDRGFIEVIKAE